MYELLVKIVYINIYSSNLQYKNKCINTTKATGILNDLKLNLKQYALLLVINENRAADGARPAVIWSRDERKDGFQETSKYKLRFLCIFGLVLVVLKFFCVSMLENSRYLANFPLVDRL